MGDSYAHVIPHIHQETYQQKQKQTLVCQLSKSVTTLLPLEDTHYILPDTQ